MRYEGYHELSDLPVKRHDWVKIPKGTPVTTSRKGTKIAGKAYTIRVDHVLPGSSEVRRATRGTPPFDLYEERFPLSNPKVRWPGNGGYWCEADINLVEKVEGKTTDNGSP